MSLSSVVLQPVHRPGGSFDHEGSCCYRSGRLPCCLAGCRVPKHSRNRAWADPVCGLRAACQLPARPDVLVRRSASRRLSRWSLPHLRIQGPSGSAVPRSQSAATCHAVSLLHAAWSHGLLLEIGRRFRRCPFQTVPAVNRKGSAVISYPGRIATLTSSPRAIAVATRLDPP